MKVFSLILVIHVITSNILAKLTMNENTELKSDSFTTMSKCVSDLIYKVYEGRALVFMAKEITDSFGEQLLMSGINATVFIGRTVLIKGKFKKIFILQPDIRKFDSLIYDILIPQKEKTSYILILWPLKPFEYLKSYISQLHERFWQKRILRVASFIPTEEGDINIYTYFPYTEQACGSGKVISKVDKCTLDGYKNNFKLFSGVEKLKNFYRCGVTCFGNTQYPESVLSRNRNGTWNIQGNVAYLLDTLQGHYNLTINVIEMLNTTYDWFYYNISSQTLFEEYEKTPFEFGFGSFTFLNTDYKNKFDYRFASTPECITWAVPMYAGKYPEFWRAYVRELPYHAWVFLGLAIFIATKLVIIGKVLEGNRVNPSEIARYFLTMTFSLITASPALKTKFVSINLFLFQWSLWVLVVRCAYEASLGSIMTIPIPIGQINSPKAILDAKLKVVGGIKMFEILQRAALDNDILMELANKFEIIPPNQSENIFLKIHKHRNLAVLQPVRYSKYSSHRFARSKNLNFKVILIKPCLIQTYAGPVIALRGSFMSSLLFKFIQRLFECGLIKYWRTKDEPHSVFRIKPKKLNLYKIHGAFVFYFIGIALSFLILFIEIIYSKRADTFKRKIKIQNVPPLQFIQ